MEIHVFNRFKIGNPKPGLYALLYKRTTDWVVTTLEVVTLDSCPRYTTTKYSDSQGTFSRMLADLEQLQTTTLLIEQRDMAEAGALMQHSSLLETITFDTSSVNSTITIPYCFAQALVT